MPRKKWSDIRAKAAPATLAAAEQMVTALRLGELRRARHMTQEEMAERLDIRQVSVSRLESRADVRVSTLRSVVRAMGGELEIVARFPDADYSLVFTDEDAEVRQIASRSPATRIGAALGIAASSPDFNAPMVARGHAQTASIVLSSES